MTEAEFLGYFAIPVRGANVGRTLTTINRIDREFIDAAQYEEKVYRRVRDAVQLEGYRTIAAFVRALREACDGKWLWNNAYNEALITAEAREDFHMRMTAW